MVFSGKNTELKAYTNWIAMLLNKQKHFKFHIKFIYVMMRS